MLGGDLGLQQVRAGRSAEVQEGLLGCGEHPGAFGDRVGVPAGAVLVFEQHEVSGGVEARGRARMLEELEREQGQHLGLLRHELRHETGEADRLVGEGGADQ